MYNLLEARYEFFRKNLRGSPRLHTNEDLIRKKRGNYHWKSTQIAAKYTTKRFRCVANDFVHLDIKYDTRVFRKSNYSLVAALPSITLISNASQLRWFNAVVIEKHCENALITGVCQWNAKPPRVSIFTRRF